MFRSLGDYIARWLGEGREDSTSTERRSRIQDIYRQMADVYTISDFLPFDAFDSSHKLFINDHSWGFVVETPPLVGCSEAMQKEINNLFTMNLPEGSSLQTLLWADPNIEHTLQLYVHQRANTDSIYQTLAERRCDHLRHLADHTRYGTHVLRNFRSIMAFSMERTSLIPPPSILSIQQHITATLGMLNLPVYVWEPDDLLAFLDGVLFPCHAKPSCSHPTKRWNDMERLADQVRCLEADVRVESDSIELRDEIQARTYTVTHFPSEWSLHAMGELIGDMERDQAQIPCPFLLHYGVHMPSQKGPKQKIRVKARYIDKQAHSPIGKYLPDIQRENAELHFVREQLNKGEKVVQTHFSVTLFAHRHHLDMCAAKLTNLFIAREWKLERNQFLHWPVLLSQLPMMWGADYVYDLVQLQKIKTTLSTEASNLLPLQGEWKGTATPAMLLAGRRGQIMSWYPFDNLSGNYNVCVVGRSGSGKSVFMQELMTSTLGLGGRVFVLDVGRSFEKTCALLGGQFIAFTPETPMNLNPFAAISIDDSNNEAQNSEADMLAMLKSVLFLMVSPRDNLSDKGAALIEQAMCEVWKDYRARNYRDRNYRDQASISHVAAWLANKNDKTAHDMAQMLFPYTEHGPYGKYFHGSGSSLTFHHPLVVLEMEELKERKDLQAVVVQMVIIHITHQMLCGDRSTPFLIVLDEAWDLLRNKQSGVFIETLARRLRKYRGSLVVGTQSVHDFFANAGAQAAFDNSDWMCWLSQKPESIEQLKKADRLTLSPKKEILLKSVRTRQGDYAEVMISGVEGYAVGRLLLDPFSQLLYSTQARDYTAIRNLMSQGLSLNETLHRLLQERSSR